MLEKLLDYWCALEIFQPSWPIKENEDIDLSKKTAPWLSTHTDSDIRPNYDIYLGCSVTHEAIKWMIESLEIEREEAPVEYDYSKLCLCALKVDESGGYVPTSFALSSFAWALGRMVLARDFNTKLDLVEMEKLEQNRLFGGMCGEI